MARVPLLPLVVLAGAVAGWSAEVPAISQALRLAGEGVAAAGREDAATYLSKMEEAVELRPDVPRLLSHLAAAQAANEQPEQAVATLGRIAALGLTLPVEKMDEFAALKPRPDFKEVLKKFTAAERPVGRGLPAFTLPDVTGLLAGIAWRAKTGEFYLGDVHHRAVWVRNAAGKLRRLTPEGDDLLGVFGLALDEAGGTLWAATAAVPAMRGYEPGQKGAGALAEIDLGTGAVRRTLPLPPPPRGEALSQLGDILLAPDGTVYLPDGGEPILWHLRPGGAALEPAVESHEFTSLQGMAITPTGVVVLSDRINGLLRLELASGAVQRIAPPAGTTLIGIAGIAAGVGNSVFAIQNDVRPIRVLRVIFDPSVETVRSVTVLESAHHTLSAPKLGAIGPDGEFYFAGNGGWTRFDSDSAAPTPPRPVLIFKTGGKVSPAKK